MGPIYLVLSNSKKIVITWKIPGKFLISLGGWVMQARATMESKIKEWKRQRILLFLIKFNVYEDRRNCVVKRLSLLMTREIKLLECIPAWLVSAKFSARAEFFADGTRELSKSKTIIARNPIDQSSLSRNNYHTTGAENYIGKVFQRF